MLDFTVKSSVHDYKVKFIEDACNVLKNEIRDGDVIIIDNKVKDLYPDLLKYMNNNTSIIGLDARENQKSYEGLITIIQELINSGFRKNHRLIGIGGGIIQDITAFTASIMYRGVSWIFFPTTLLAQGDSCIGSKTSINFGEFKNQIGGFYPPNQIFINLSFLDTLSPEDLQSGLGEMSHYFVVAGGNDFKEYKQDYDIALTDNKVLAKMISDSLIIKKSYIEIDEFDQKERQVFNYGHSFGHAIESLTNYAVPHGIAVSFGMDMANFISVKKKYITMQIRYEIRELLEKIWSGYDLKDIDVEKFTLALSKDKKNVGDELRLILCKGYGKVFKDAQCLDDEFRGWLKDYFTNELN
ncbi:MAG: 3-dehydroquinate synthase [Candidatus Magasanikbacteria bacterium]|nr:3-dehydroquinate synthase [Candidatus Magasanikbacteria bacterium]